MVNTKYIHKYNIILNKTVTKIVTILTKCFFSYLNLKSYLNDLTEDLTSNVKLFADDTSLFSAVHDAQTSTNNLNKDLEIINNWDFP